MKKVVLVLIILVKITLSLWSQTNYIQPQLIIGVDSNVWAESVIFRNSSNVTKIISNGERVYGGYGTMKVHVNNEYDYVTDITHNNQRFFIQSNNLRPASGIFLPENWITTINVEKKWVISYYLDALISQDRSIFLKYEKQWIDFRAEWLKKYEGESSSDWYDVIPIEYESLVFNHAGVIMGGFDRSEFFILDIESINNGYRITMTGDRRFANYEESDYETRLPFPRYSERQSFEMIFIPDGDYMDVYLDSLDNIFASFVKVDNNVLIELEKLVKTNTVNLSSITHWPRRADGSMDYPPPTITTSNDQGSSQEIEQVVDNELTIETESPQTTKDSQFPLWLFIGGGLVLLLAAVGVGVIIMVKRKKG